MKRVMPWMLVLFVVGLVACSPKADDVDDKEDTQYLATVSDLPSTTSTASVFFMVNGKKAANLILTPYSFKVGSNGAFVPSVDTVDVVRDIVASGVYFAPPRASEGPVLAYNTKDKDSLVLNYRTGEMWTKLGINGEKFRPKQLTRSNGKDFMDWSVSDPEIESLNLFLSNAGKTPLVAGDEIYVEFVIISDNANGSYLQYFTLKSYTLK